MSTTHEEIERKYEAPADREATPDLRGLKRLTADDQAQLQNLDATYFDTADRALAGQKVILRRRRGGHDEGWHIKFVVGAARQEVHFDLLKDESAMPAAVKNVLSGITLGERLEPMARLETRRMRTLLRDDDGRAVAELCDDTVHSTDHAAGVERRWREWEVELLVEDLGPKAQNKVFKDVEKVLREAGAAPSTSVAKIARAMGQDPAFDAEAGIRTSVAPKNAGEDSGLSGSQSLISALLHEYLDDVPTLDLGARVGLEDSVHQLRIRLRGIRSVLRGLRGVIDHDAEKKLGAGLKETGLALSDARDLEVVREVLVGLSGWGRQTHAAQERLLALLDEDEEGAVHAARTRLSSAEHLDLMRDLRAFVAQPRLEAAASDWGSKKVAKTMLDSLGDRLSARGKRARDVEDPWAEDTLDEIHDVRKAAKSLRYAIDSLTAESAVPKKRSDDVAVARKRAKKLQSRLGEILDMNATREWLDHAARVFQRREVDRFAVGVLSGELEVRLREALAQGVVTAGRVR